jgi:transposase
MEVLYERCCGIDVHKSSVAACILLDRGHKPQKHLRRFGCTTRDLRELAEWLRSFDVRHVAMESRQAFIGSLYGTCWKSTSRWCLLTLSTSRLSQAVRPT